MLRNGEGKRKDQFQFLISKQIRPLLQFVTMVLGFIYFLMRRNILLLIVYVLIYLKELSLLK
ncbi:DUF2628 domain-containing protein [Metabacillus niabensis]|uniref:DUF2628 domain-containing protein n=1 Tax=Metabacillus niabensis TaxID=324854 RepID=UPI00113FD485